MKFNKEVKQRFGRLSKNFILAFKVLINFRFSEVNIGSCHLYTYKKLVSLRKPLICMYLSVSASNFQSYRIRFFNYPSFQLKYMDLLRDNRESYKKNEEANNPLETSFPPQKVVLRRDIFWHQAVQIIGEIFSFGIKHKFDHKPQKISQVLKTFLKYDLK